MLKLRLLLYNSLPLWPFLMVYNNPHFINHEALSEPGEEQTFKSNLCLQFQPSSLGFFLSSHDIFFFLGVELPVGYAQGINTTGNMPVDMRECSCYIWSVKKAKEKQQGGVSVKGLSGCL